MPLLTLKMGVGAHERIEEQLLGAESDPQQGIRNQSLTTA